MNLTEPFVLRRDAVLTPCAELMEEVRGRLDFAQGDVTLSMRRSRASVHVIDSETASLLQLFREPHTIADAVVENSRALGKSPAAWFDEMLPHLVKLVDSRFLVPAGSAEELEVLARYESGATAAGCMIVRCVSLCEDTEIYEVRRGNQTAALKIARQATGPLRLLFKNETAILRRLNGTLAPRLVEAGTWEERPYIVMDWIPGQEAGALAVQRRHDRVFLIELCASIAAAYAALHERGVVHGDVHPRNIIAGDGRITLIDFGWGVLPDERPRMGHGGIPHYAEPELAASSPPTAAGEQYSLAAVLYYLIAGAHYLDFRYHRDDMKRQTETELPLPFARRGVPPWPEVERILFRALEKDPSRRYESVAEMAAGLANAHRSALTASPETPLTANARELLGGTLRALSRDGRLFASGFPTAGVSIGSAGAAVALLCIAASRGDAALLALAEIWRSRASASLGDENAFVDAESGITPAKAGVITPYHRESGIHAVHAMIAAAMGDMSVQRAAIASFVSASRKPCANLDLSLGRSGALLISALLLEDSEDPALITFGSETLDSIWRELDTHPPIAGCPDGTFFGIAHGWAGYIYAALRWCAASGEALPPRLMQRLHELAELGTAAGRGVSWPMVIGKPGTMAGWCNGSAGHVYLFALAHRMFGDDRWLRLAELCAWATWDQVTPSKHHYCCGTAGRAYALLHLYKHTGAREWLGRARQLANQTAAGVPDRLADTLWRGNLGIAVLIADLAAPETARMPFFE